MDTTHRHAGGGGGEQDNSRGRLAWKHYVGQTRHQTDQKLLWNGPADVMVTHDCPSGVTHSFPPPPIFWDSRDLARGDRHRERLQVVVDQVQPRYLMHGHLHSAYQRLVDFGYGPCEVTSLDCDEGAGPNYAVLDVVNMKWSARRDTGQRALYLCRSSLAEPME